MKNKRLLAAFSIIALFSIILVGCSADQLSGAGSTLGQLRNAGTGHGGDSHVSTASEFVSSFVEEFESCLNLNMSYRKVKESGQEMIIGNVGIYPYLETLIKLDILILDSSVDLVKVAECAADDSGLRTLLDTPYKDYDGVRKSYRCKTLDWYSYRKVGDFFQVSDMCSALVYTILGTDVDLRDLNSMTIPFPAQVSDVLVVLNKAFEMTKHTGLILKLLKNSGKDIETDRALSGKKVAIDLSFLVDGIAAYVGDRKEPTVGDKITVCLLYDVIDQIIDCLDLYVELHPEEKDAMGMYTYASLTSGWILGNCSDELDRIMTDLEAVGYIYDFNIDVASVFSGLLN